MRELLNRLINIIFKPAFDKLRKAEYERIKLTVQTKLNRNDIKEVGLITLCYYSNENFEKLKKATEENSIGNIDIERSQFDTYGDMMWVYQVILSDNSAYIIIYYDLYQDPSETPKAYMSVRYFHKIETSLKLEGKDISYKI